MSQQKHELFINSKHNLESINWKFRSHYHCFTALLFANRLLIRHNNCIVALYIFVIYKYANYIGTCICSHLTHGRIKQLYVLLHSYCEIR
jgi:hypothetical protein